MKRQDKYPDSDVFHFYNANPHNRITTDCVIRAISTATEIPYNQVVMEMAELQCKTGFDPSENKAIDKYLTSKGWTRMPQPKKEDNTKYTGAEFCRWINDIDHQNLAIVCSLGTHHMACIKRIEEKFKVWDTWNSTRGKVGIIWVKSPKLY